MIRLMVMKLARIRTLTLLSRLRVLLTCLSNSNLMDLKVFSLMMLILNMLLVPDDNGFVLYGRRGIAPYRSKVTGHEWCGLGIMSSLGSVFLVLTRSMQ